MHAAAYSDFPECVALLLDRGADVNYASNVRSSPSWRLALRRASRPALTAGCAPRRQNGQVALHFCAYFERNEVMELLLKRGAKTEVPDEVRPAAQPCRRCCACPHAAWPHAAQNDANYPLHMASIANSVECARLLVQYKANKGAKNKVRGPEPAAAAPAVRLLTARCVRGAELRRPDAAGQRQHSGDEGRARLEASRSSVEGARETGTTRPRAASPLPSGQGHRAGCRVLDIHASSRLCESRHVAQAAWHSLSSGRLRHARLAQVMGRARMMTTEERHDFIYATHTRRAASADAPLMRCRIVVASVACGRTAAASPRRERGRRWRRCSPWCGRCSAL